MIVTLKRLFNDFVFGNFFIALCSAAMIWTTFLLNGIPVKVTPFTVFLSIATYLLYNFHRISYRIDFSGLRKFFLSLNKIHFTRNEKLFYVFSFVAMFACIFLLNFHILYLMIPLTLLALSYSIPMISMRKKKITLPELPLIKTPVLALVWGVTTTLVPVIEQNISFNTSFIWLQVFSRCLFIFALCIPFELRDVEIDKLKNIRTFPVIFGIKAAKIWGSVIILLELLTHHLMHSLSSSAVLVLDLTSLLAFFWIILQNNRREPYFYKFLIDGTMLIRFLLLFIVINLK
jgi:4-hydroxybenzoate polyprenyltransferase